MALMIELIETTENSFDEVVSQLVWVDSVVEKYDTIMKKTVWDLLSRPKICWFHMDLQSDV